MNGLLNIWSFGVYGYLGILVMSVAVNLIPFASPSNLVMSGVVMLMFPGLNPFYVAFFIAVGATASKSSHYYLSHSVAKMAKVEEERVSRYRSMLNRWGSLGSFLAAVSPIPDDPVVIPLGLVRFSFPKFITAYFSGKLLTCLIGSLSASQITRMTNIFDVRLAPISLALSIIAVSLILKMDPNRLEKLFIKGVEQGLRGWKLLKKLKRTWRMKRTSP